MTDDTQHYGFRVGEHVHCPTKNISGIVRNSYDGFILVEQADSSLTYIRHTALDTLDTGDTNMNDSPAPEGADLRRIYAIPPHIANHVLYAAGETNCHPPGSFITALLAAWFLADAANQQRLADSFPIYGEAMRLYSRIDGGVQILRELAKYPSAKPEASPVHVARYAYRDTDSEAGKPKKYMIRVTTVRDIRRWVNSNGNPTYVIRTAENDGPHTYMCVDDFGATNDLSHKRVLNVPRRKDLFQ